jgi:holo-[acyl-carrier protein] synthase
MEILYGIEMTALGAFEQVACRPSNALFERIFTSQESAYCRSKRFKHENYGARFAAKKAILRALGIEPSPSLFRHIRVRNRANGQPLIDLSKTFCRRFGIDLKRTAIHVSLAHEKQYAVAAAIITRR